MGAIYSILIKDLRLLLRDRSTVFLTFVWPLVLATFFGALGPGFGAALEHDADGEGGGMLVVLVVDDDHSAASELLVAELDADPLLVVEPSVLTDARDAVRLGTTPAYVHIGAGFGASPSDEAEPRALELGVDPRRLAETKVLAGATKLAAWRSLARERDPERAPGREAVALSFEPVSPTDASADGPPNPFAVTFPQGIIWAVLACAATFAVSLVEEHERGTLLRLSVAPVPRLSILIGKASACMVAIIVMELVLLGAAVIGFGVRPQSPGFLTLALASTAFGFVGLMTLLAVIGRRTQSASGLSWAILMSMAMVGGGMLPLFLMPSWLQLAAHVSPVAWALMAIEGAVWRGYDITQLGPLCGALVLLGLVCFAIGTRSVREL